jgi:hypothetical protein
MLAPIPNGLRDWHGVDAEPGLERRNLLRIGDCSWIQIEHAHTYGPAGYPYFAAQRLLEHGIAMGFSNYAAVHLDGLPTDERLERYARESPPDAILIQVASAYSSHELLRIGPISAGRTWVNWKLGALGGANHRHVVAPLLRRWGRPVVDMPDRPAFTAELLAFVARLRRVFPGVPTAIAPPHADSRTHNDRMFVRLDETGAAIREAAAEAGVPLLDYSGPLRAAMAAGATDLHCANLYNLRRAGHELAAEPVAEWLLNAWAPARPSERRAESVA